MSGPFSSCFFFWLVSLFLKNHLTKNQPFTGILKIYIPPTCHPGSKSADTTRQATQAMRYAVA
jgi:hypothetical protein